MNRALITFTPLEPYFFGSELTHGDGGANYFAVGNRWPQQSTLCGFLRHLLHNAGYNRGNNSFTPDDPKRNDFGDLKSISPLFLGQRNNGKLHFFHRQAFDRHEDLAPFKPGIPDKNHLTFNTSSQGWTKSLFWEGFDHKKNTADAWIRQDGTVTIPSDEIFLERTRPGITKKPDDIRLRREAGFYKQLSYQLAPNWCFAVLADFEEEVDLAKLQGHSLPMGGEKTVFSVALTSESKDFSDLFSAPIFYPGQAPPLPLLILCSDAFVPAAALAHTTGGITETVDFRHIRTHLNVQEFGPLKRLEPSPNGSAPAEEARHMTKSTKFSLMARGSVLVCADNDSLKKLQKELTAEDLTPWRTIGFNHFLSYPLATK